MKYVTNLFDGPLPETVKNHKLLLRRTVLFNVCVRFDSIEEIAINKRVSHCVFVIRKTLLECSMLFFGNQKLSQNPI